MTNDEVWKLVIENEALLRRELRRHVPRHRHSDLEEAYSDVVLARAVAIMRTYQPARGVLPITHLCACVRWYAYKWGHRRCYKDIPTPMTDLVNGNQNGHLSRELAPWLDLGDGAKESEVTEIRSHVQGLLTEVARQDDTAAKLLEWHLIKGYTFEEIAEHFEPDDSGDHVTKAMVKSMYHEAIELARGIGVHRQISRWLEALLDVDGHVNGELTDASSGD